MLQIPWFTIPDYRPHCALLSKKNYIAIREITFHNTVKISFHNTQSDHPVCSLAPYTSKNKIFDELPLAEVLLIRQCVRESIPHVVILEAVR